MPTLPVDLATLGRYEGLALRVRHGLGTRPGDRRLPGRAQPAGIEVESHSAYAPGDDLRHLDWNAVGRLDALLVRRFVAEREVVFHLLVDTSASMGVPPRDRKLAVACELALALATIALTASDAVRVALLGGDRPVRVSPVYRQRGGIAPVAELLAGARAGGSLALGAALEEHAHRSRAPGAALVISDLMLEPAELARGVLALRACGFEVALLHVIGARELDPGRHFHDGILADVESGATHAVALTPATLARYREVLAGHLAALAALAARAEALYARLPTDVSVATFVLGELFRAGLVRRR